MSSSHNSKSQSKLRNNNSNIYNCKVKCAEYNGESCIAQASKAWNISIKREMSFSVNVLFSRPSIEKKLTGAKCFTISCSIRILNFCSVALIIKH